MGAATGIKGDFRRPAGRAAALLGPLLAAGLLCIPALAATRDTIPAPAIEDALPAAFHPLTSADVTRYQTIFDLQRRGDWAGADREIARLKDRLLVGHVLQQRYMSMPGASPDYRSTFAELAEWLRHYRDHPGADAVHRLAMSRKSKADRPPLKPVAADVREFAGEALVPNVTKARPVRKRRSAGERRVVSQAEAAMMRHIRAGHPGQAERVIERADVQHALSASELDEWKKRVAQSHFIDGDDSRALALASAAARRSREQVPDADWIAGLSAWRTGRFDNAAYHFEQLAASDVASDWDTAAGAYWAARVALKLRQPQEFSRLLNVAAEQPRTFYGMLALRQLGQDLPMTWQAPQLKPDDARKLQAMPAVRRAVALSDVGQTSAAERELRQLRPRLNDQLAGALLALASRLDTPASLFQLGVAWRDSTGEAVDVALYPLPTWEPESGFQIDRALVFAFMRQESAFNARALSPAGASGLMQLMPRTASFVAGQSTLRQKQNRHRLFAPEYNIELGQRYLQHLLETPPVNGNLLYLAAAYNAGPGNLQKWIKALRFDDDPLLFAEMIPLAETRNFVERIATNLWIYRARLGLPQPSLDNLTVGNWPLYDGGDAGLPGEAVATGNAGN